MTLKKIPMTTGLQNFKLFINNPRCVKLCKVKTTDDVSSSIFKNVCIEAAMWSDSASVTMVKK